MLNLNVLIKFLFVGIVLLIFSCSKKLINFNPMLRNFYLYYNLSLIVKVIFELFHKSLQKPNHISKLVTN